MTPAYQERLATISFNCVFPEEQYCQSVFDQAQPFPDQLETDDRSKLQLGFVLTSKQTIVIN